MVRQNLKLRASRIAVLFLSMCILVATMFLVALGSVSTEQSRYAQAKTWSSGTNDGHIIPNQHHAQTTVLSPYTSSETFQVLTQTMTISVPLGTRQDIDIVITNATTRTLHPVLYEAWPAPPAGVVLSPDEAVSLQSIALPDQTSRVDPQILLDLAAAPDHRTEFLVFLQEQPDLSYAYALTDWQERGWYVYNQLKTTAERSQQNIRAWLDERDIPYRPLWIVNALAVEGTQADVETLEGYAEVAMLRANRVVSIDDQDMYISAVSNCTSDTNGTCWNIRKINADDVWQNFGVSGAGVTVANLDSGVKFDHTALVKQYRGYENSNKFDHSYNWYDALGISSVPSDAGNHGTHTMGTMVGRGDGTDVQPAVGVAPGARWIAARGCGSTLCNETDLIASAQWFLAPTDINGQNPRPDLRPHIINNSWAAGKGNDDQYVDFTVAWRAAGIFPVFAAGNHITVECGSINSPGDYTNVVGVGATDSFDGIAYFSRLGPTHDGRIKPDISAPGSGIASTYAGTGLSYGTLNGTSMASPHVAGVVALLWSANPALIGDYDATYDLITSTATPRLDSTFNDPEYAECPANVIPNNVYGYGIIDSYQAVAAAQVDVPWLDVPDVTTNLASNEMLSIKGTLDMRHVAEPGEYRARVLIGTGDLSETPVSVELTVQVTATSSDYATVHGNIHDESGQPLTAQVDIEPGPQVHVDTSGTFDVVLPATEDAQTYTFDVSSSGYVNTTKSLTLTAGMERTLAVTLPLRSANIVVTPVSITATLDYNTHVSSMLTITNSGTLDLEYEMSAPNHEFAVWRSDEDSSVGKNWITKPVSAVDLNLGDDTSSGQIPLGFDFAFGDTSFSKVYVNSNGMLIFDGLEETNGFLPICPPIPETQQGAIMPFRADLDPSQGGSIWYAGVADGFVVTFDHVPLHDLQTTSFTFQVVLMRDGLIRFNYNELSSLPTSASVGVQFPVEQAQTIGCGTTTPITSGLTIELRPQVNSDTWFMLPSEFAKGTVAIGKAQSIPLTLNWVSNMYTQPYRSMLEIESNDTQESVLQVPVVITMLPLIQEVVISGSQDAFLDFVNSTGLGFHLDIDATSVSQQTKLQYTELMTPTIRPSSDSAFAGHRFLLEAFQDDNLVSELTFQPPLMLTLGYRDTGMSELEEEQLRLYSWNGTEWTAIESDVGHDVEKNQVTVGIKRLGEYALFYNKVYYIVHLPMVSREF